MAQKAIPVLLHTYINHKVSDCKFISEFTDYLRAELRGSELTAEAYGRDLLQFAAYCDKQSCERQNATDSLFDFDPKRVTPRDVRSWIGSLAEKGKAPSTLRRKLQSLRAFYAYGMRTGKLNSNPAADIMLPKKKKKLPNFIKEQEVEEALDNSDGTFEAERRHITVELLYTLGLRRAEILALTDSDIHSDTIRVTGKRNKTRILPLPEPLAQEIARWQRIRDDRYPTLPHPRPLIAGVHGPVSASTLHKIVSEALVSTSAAHKSPHTLRHTFATSMINHGADLDAVREMLGHESLATTQIYTHLSVNELMAGYAKAHPRSLHRDTPEKPNED